MVLVCGGNLKWYLINKFAEKTFKSIKCLDWLAEKAVCGDKSCISPVLDKAFASIFSDTLSYLITYVSNI